MSLKKINNIYYFWNYDKDFKTLVSTMKFKNKKGLAVEISELIKEGIIFVLEKEKIDYIIPVPISKERKIERGFNQVEIILDELKLQYLEIKRIKNTKKMFQILEEKKRDENIKNSFCITTDADLNNRSILLFDDIVTTGSTLREIKKELQKVYSVKKIIVLTLAAAREIKVNKGEI
ncbi:MAG: ComF family protein [Sebaldella sp.]|nr:ComF family protein [Sebaldella sp.]